MKNHLWITLAALVAFPACSPESAEQPAQAPDAVPEVVTESEELLPTPEEEAAKAAETIDEGNADAELQRLQEELGDG